MAEAIHKDLHEKKLRHEGKIRSLQEDIKRSEIDRQRLTDELQVYRREAEMAGEQRQELDASRQRKQIKHRGCREGKRI